MFEMGKILFILLFMINIPNAFSQDIVILADNAIWDRKKEITTLTGNVLITKGSISISSTTIRVIGKLSTLNEVIGEGNVKIIDREKNVYISGEYMKYCHPTEYLLITNMPKLELKNEDVTITSLKMEGFYKEDKFIATNSVKIIHNDTVVTSSKAVYSADKHRLELTGNPEVIQDENRLTGKKIVYYIKEGRFEVIEGVKALLIRR